MSFIDGDEGGTWISLIYQSFFDQIVVINFKSILSDPCDEAIRVCFSLWLVRLNVSILVPLSLIKVNVLLL